MERIAGSIFSVGIPIIIYTIPKLNLIDSLPSLAEKKFNENHLTAVPDRCNHDAYKIHLDNESKWITKDLERNLEIFKGWNVTIGLAQFHAECKREQSSIPFTNSESSVARNFAFDPRPGMFQTDVSVQY